MCLPSTFHDWCVFINMRVNEIVYIYIYGLIDPITKQLRYVGKSESHKDINKGDEHPIYGKHRSEETKKKISEQLTLKVIQLSLKSEVIKIWSSIKEAQKDLKIGNISSCCRNKRKTAGGFKWKYFN